MFRAAVVWFRLAAQVWYLASIPPLHSEHQFYLLSRIDKQLQLPWAAVKDSANRTSAFGILATIASEAH